MSAADIGISVTGKPKNKTKQASVRQQNRKF